MCLILSVCDQPSHTIQNYNKVKGRWTVTKHLWRVQPSCEAALMQSPQGMAQKDKDQEPALPMVWDTHIACTSLLGLKSGLNPTHSPRQDVFTILCVWHLSDPDSSIPRFHPGGLYLQASTGPMAPQSVLASRTAEVVLGAGLQLGGLCGVRCPPPIPMTSIPQWDWKVKVVLFQKFFRIGLPFFLCALQRPSWLESFGSRCCHPAE